MTAENNPPGTEECVHYRISRDRRLVETIIDGSPSITGGYRDLGCYDCDGKNPDCRNYHAEGR